MYSNSPNVSYVTILFSNFTNKIIEIGIIKKKDQTESRLLWLFIKLINSCCQDSKNNISLNTFNAGTATTKDPDHILFVL